MEKRSKLLIVATAILLSVTVAGLIYTTPWVGWYYRRELEPSIALGEEVFRRYEAYWEEHQQYPTTPADIDLPELAYFDSIHGWRDDSTDCTDVRRRCKELRIVSKEGRSASEGTVLSEPARTVQGKLVVVVFDGMFRCPITNLERNWRCRDMS
ncbi:MAG: hypothetical protein AAGF95_31740 [Chloroflexota bacterium]